MYFPADLGFFGIHKHLKPGEMIKVELQQYYYNLEVKVTDNINLNDTEPPTVFQFYGPWDEAMVIHIYNKSIT